MPLVNSSELVEKRGTLLLHLFLLLSLPEISAKSRSVSKDVLVLRVLLVVNGTSLPSPH